MGFGLNLGSTGDFLRAVKFDARAGRFFRIDRREDTGEQEAVDITDAFEGVFDLAHAEAGWAHFQPGLAPDFAMAPVGDSMPAQPSKNHRPAVRLRLMLSSKCAGGTDRLREIVLTAKSAIRGLEALYDQWLAGREHNPGKAVLARLAGAKPVLSGGGGQKSTNYEPTFAIVKWAKPPDEFAAAPERPAPPGNGGAAAGAYQAAKGGSPPPVPNPQPAPVDAEDEWG
jgi:hypothetical protein